MQNGGGGMVDGLKAEAMSQAMLEVRAQPRLLHNLARGPIYYTRLDAIAYTLERCILGSHTRLMRLAPLGADRSDEEGTRQLGPVAVDANLHLHHHRITIREGSLAGQSEGAIGQRGSGRGGDLGFGCTGANRL